PRPCLFRRTTMKPRQFPAGVRHLSVAGALLPVCGLLSIVPGRFQQSAAVPPTDNSPGAGVTQLVTPNAPQTVVYGRVKLEFPAGAVFAPTNITITPLGLSDVHVLDTAMTNVTPAPQVGYRFSPDGSRFAKPITISMPYDPVLIPMGLSEQDLFTYYF